LTLIVRAAIAIAHKILVAAYHMLASGAPFRDLGEAFLDQQTRKRTTANLIRRLNTLGYMSPVQGGGSPGPTWTVTACFSGFPACKPLICLGRVAETI
jgi:hypothetical protein